MFTTFQSLSAIIQPQTKYLGPVSNVGEILLVGGAAGVARYASFTFSTGSTYTISSVGAGGTSISSGSASLTGAGGNTVMTYSGGTVTAGGGGYGGSNTGSGNKNSQQNAAGCGAGCSWNTQSALAGTTLAPTNPAGWTYYSTNGGNNYYANPYVAGGAGGATSAGANATSTQGGNGGQGYFTTLINYPTGDYVSVGGGGASYSISSTNYGRGGNNDGYGDAEHTGVAATAGKTYGCSSGSCGGTGNTPPNGKAGCAILLIPSSTYTGNYTGSPIITTQGYNTVLLFTGAGSYTH